MLDKLIGVAVVGGAYLLGVLVLDRGIATPDDDELHAEHLDRLARDAQWQTDLRWTGETR